MATPWYRPKYESPGQPQFTLSAEQLDVVEELAVFHCALEEIGCAFGVCRATMQAMCRRQPEINQRIAIGQAKGKRALRSVQFRVALSGNVSMLIWLGRCILKQLPADELHMHVNGDAEDAELSPAAKEHLSEIARHLNQVAIAASATEVDAEVEVITGDGTIERKIVPMN
jgi:hypothetical protein